MESVGFAMRDLYDEVLWSDPKSDTLILADSSKLTADLEYFVSFRCHKYKAT